MPNPYIGLPPDRFWKSAVAGKSLQDMAGIYRKRFSVSPQDRIATMGSCFAQHVTASLRAAGFDILDVEPAPVGLRGKQRAKFGYGIYSARYGNIYTARHLLQLAQEAFGTRQPADFIWERDGRYFDALRPNVEPLGLESPEEVIAHRTYHIGRVRELFDTMDFFIFTFGLTEAWTHAASSTVYPMAPDVICGTYDQAIHSFVNFTVSEVFEDFSAFRSMVKDRNPDCRFIVTVSPVPLTATASGNHVLVASTASKAVLRAAVGQLYNSFPDIDYFPSYELIGTPFLGCSFADNMREVNPASVDAVMSIFLKEHGSARKLAPSADQTEIVCEEQLLSAFG